MKKKQLESDSLVPHHMGKAGAKLKTSQAIFVVTMALSSKG